MPDEVLDAHMLAVLGVPIAASFAELQSVPVLLIRQRLLMK